MQRLSFGKLACLLLLFFAAVGLNSCTPPAYQLTIENHINQEVTTHINGEREYHVRPCSVQINSAFSVPPNQPIEVEIKDAIGNEISRAQVLPKGGRIPMIYVRIPTTGDPGVCPAPISGMYTLHVENISKSEAHIYLNNVELGSVQSGSTRTFGPLSGAWETKMIHTEDSDGNGILMYFDMPVDYDLGRVPQFRAIVTSEWP